jgi:ribosome-associated toxin RatA of RatAB toxin-antitoxin module
VLIQERVEFEGDPEVVWARLSDIESIPDFWHGTRAIEIISREEHGDVEAARARVKFAFGGSGEVEIIADRATRTLTSDYVSGPFKGTQVVRVVGNALEARWEVSFTGIFRLTSGWTGGHFKTGTVHALERLAGRTPQEESPSQA